MDKRLLNVGLVVLLDMLGFALIVPLLTFYADSFGAAEYQTGLLVSSYALMQMISAPVLGRLSDRYGRRPVFLISILGTFIGFLILGFANSLMAVVCTAASFRGSPREISLWRKPTLRISPMKRTGRA